MLLGGALLVLWACLGHARRLPDSMRLPSGGLEHLRSKANASCPCLDPDWCNPVTVQHDKEVFGFHFSLDELKWNIATTIAWEDSPNLVCHAHAQGVRVIAGAPAGMPLTANATQRAEYVSATVAKVQALHLDGVTFDFEDPLPRGDPRREWYVELVRMTSEAMHSAVPGSQVSVCVAWSPDDIDGRDYDYVGLASASDLLYQMVYDTRSQVFGRCIASANSPLSVAQRGIQRYLDIGVPASKLVMGIPWYGYTYKCVGSLSNQDDMCVIDLVPFRGVNCSDAAGSEISFASAMKILDSGGSTTGRRWDASTQSPYFNYVAADGSLHQLWYDDVQSLSLKYAYARDVGVRGTGPFTFTDVDPSGSSGNPLAPAEADAMWQALRVFTGK